MKGKRKQRHQWLLLVMIGFLVAVAVAGCAGQDTGSGGMALTSTAFSEGQAVPTIYTCDGDDISPPLAWTGMPDGTASLALIMDDPDAPGRTWVHWVLTDLPPDLTGLPQEVASTVGVQGHSSWGRPGYGGPCPPSGSHRYYFRLYALDRMLNLTPGAEKDEVLEAMEGHILAEAELMGRYQRP